MKEDFSKLVYLLAGKIIQKEMAGAATQLIAPVKIGLNGDRVTEEMNYGNCSTVLGL